MSNDICLGIDIGSVSTNIVAIKKDSEIVFSKYIRTNGQPIETVKNGLLELKNKLPKFNVCGVGTTGSGRQMVGLIIGADAIKNEITTHAVGTVHFHPDVKTIFEIGGQDSKIILLQNGLVVDFSMNTVCAAGTGSFLDHQAERLKIPIESFGDLALTAKNEVRIAGRCTVFAESDMIAKQQYGFSKAEIIKGLCNALVRNYINNLGRGKKLEPPFVFQGGVAANKGIINAFEEEIGHSVIIPKYYGVMGAFGAALLAYEHIKNTQTATKFRGFDATDFNFKTSSFVCSGCSNSCEVTKVEAHNKIIACWGDKCGKWSNSSESLD